MSVKPKLDLNDIHYLMEKEPWTGEFLEQMKRFQETAFRFLSATYSTKWGLQYLMHNCHVTS